MLLTDNEYLRLVAEGLTRDVLPELQSSNARAKASMCIQAVRELMHRNAVLPGLISNLAPRGVDLISRGRAILDGCGVAPSEAPPSPGTVQARAAIFSILTAQLDEYARLILDHAVSNPSRTQEARRWLREVAEWEVEYYNTFQQLEMPSIGTTDISGRPLTQDILLAHLRAAVPELSEASVENFQNIPGGFSNETFFFDLVRGDGTREKLVIRKKAQTPFFDYWANRARDEFAICSVLFEAGLPLAKPLWLFDNMPDVDGAYYVMTRGEGSTFGSHDAAFGSGQTFPEKLIFNIAEFLARLHTVSLDSFADYLATGDTTARLGDTISDVVRKNVEFYQQYWRTSRRRPCPSEAYVLDWLLDNVPENSRSPSMVHTDCFVHNILIDSDYRITTVVDWESAHFGDPAEDLAYIRDQVSQVMNWDRFMDHYYKAGGAPVDQSHLDYYKALLNFRNSWGTNIAVTRVQNGFYDIRMTALGSTYFTTWMNSNLDATR